MASGPANFGAFGAFGQLERPKPYGFVLTALMVTAIAGGIASITAAAGGVAAANRDTDPLTKAYRQLAKVKARYDKANSASKRARLKIKIDALMAHIDGLEGGSDAPMAPMTVAAPVAPVAQAGMSTNTKVLIGGGVLLALIAVGAIGLSRRQP